MGVFCFRDEIVILVVLQNFNEFFVDIWRCVFGEMLENCVVLREDIIFCDVFCSIHYNQVHTFVSCYIDVALVFPEIF